MTNTQTKDIFTEWALYEPRQQKLMINEYFNTVGEEDCSRERFLEFLKEKLEIKGYWEKTDLT